MSIALGTSLPAAVEFCDMRSITFMVFVLFVAGWIACQIDFPRGEIAHQPHGHWRRTVDGWEKVVVEANSVSIVPSDQRNLALGDLWAGHPHPIVISLLLPMLSALLLIAASPKSSTNPPTSAFVDSGR